MALLEDRFQPNMTVSDLCPLLHAHMPKTKTTKPWPSIEIRKACRGSR